MPVGILPVDAAGHYFEGVGDYKPAGTRVGSTDFAIQHVVLVDLYDNPLLINYLVITHNVGGAATFNATVLAANASRKYALLINDSPNLVYLNLAGGVAAVGTGVRLEPNGGSYEMSRNLGNLVVNAINAVTVTGTANILTSEGV